MHYCLQFPDETIQGKTYEMLGYQVLQFSLDVNQHLVISIRGFGKQVDTDVSNLCGKSYFLNMRPRISIIGATW